ncbi:MAG: homoserine O-acetyltransferase [Bacteroidales bacterium]|nr:homoserine O-acetyltransferase [Bacteroidales bacterium]
MTAHVLTTDKPFHFEAGGVLDSIDIAYHTSGCEYSPGKKVIWICHGLTANSDVEDWWPELTGPGKTIDTEKYFVVCVNLLGSAYGSSSPRSVNPLTGKPYFFDFPAVTIRDMARTCIEVRKHLGIETVDLLIGSSIGGFQAMEWSIMEPEVCRNILFLATAPRISPWLGAMVEAQRMALEADSTFRRCKDLTGGVEGLKCARAQALISYRCFKGYGITQKEDDPDCLFAKKVASYERYQGLKLVRRNFDASSYYSLCNSFDSHNVGRGRNGVENALSHIKARVITAAVDTDIIFPPLEMEEWYRYIPGAVRHVIHSDYGHDGFLLESNQIKRLIDHLLD